MLDRSRRRPAVHPAVDLAAAYSWRLLVTAAAVAGALWLLGRLRFVVIALVVALLVVQVLVPPARWLRARGLRPGLAAATALMAFLIATGTTVALIGAAVADDIGSVGPTVTTALDDVEDWLVADGPVSVSRESVERFRDGVANALRDTFASSSGAVVSRALRAAETFVAILVGLVLAFFGLKDGDRITAYARDLLPEHRRPLADRLARRAWQTVGGFLRGAATLGAIEGVIVAVTLTAVGAGLAVPVGVLTFLAAFVPFVGAVVAGVVAVLVALADAGTTAALVVAAVMLVVQQLDNEVLGPWVYGRMLSLHPVVVLLAVASGGALFGIAGTFLAVPVTAVAINTVGELRSGRTSRHPK